MFRPWLWLPPQLAHDWGQFFLRLLGVVKAPSTPCWSSVSWRGFQFHNPVGVAGGVDKDALQVKGWWSLGCGFIEVGTVTPKSQPGNSGRRIGRNIPLNALWNRMGFPSHGAAAVKSRLQKLNKRATPILVNIGKNATTPQDQAHQDYIFLISEFASCADGFVLNISSPNTKGLRDLLLPHNLNSFLDPIMSHFKELKKNHKNLFMLLKISPDLSYEQLRGVLMASHALGVDGWVLTNTTTHREVSSPFPPEGGVSGAPLKSRSIQVLKDSITILGSARQDQLIISCGGVLSAEDVQERLNYGADLVQVYSALVLNGPGFFLKLAEFFKGRVK